MSGLMNFNKKRPKISNMEKAALVLLSFSKENIARVFSFLDDDEVKELSRAMSSLGPIDGEIIDEVLEEFKGQVNQFVTVVGHFESAEDLLQSVLGKEKFMHLMEDIRGPSANGKSTWDKLATVNEDLLATYLKNEHPQTIALIMSKISPITSSKVLSNLPEELTFDVITRILNMDSVKNETLERVEDTLRSDFISTIGKVQKRDNNEILAEIFNNFDRSKEAKFMGMLEEKIPEQATKVKELMFTFDDMVKLLPADVQLLLKNVDKAKLPVALKGASDEIKRLFINSLSERAAKILTEDMEALGPVRIKDVEDAQTGIVQALKKMIDNKEIIVSTGAKDEFI